MAVKIKARLMGSLDIFLSRLCGGEGDFLERFAFCCFLSRLCGGEVSEQSIDTTGQFLSRLCGGEG